MSRLAILDSNNPLALNYGIVLGIVPKDIAYEVEIQRAPDSAGSPGTPVSLGSRLYAQSGDVFVDVLPNDAALWYYRARHIVSGGTAGQWSNWTGGITADVLPSTYSTINSSIYPVRRDLPLHDSKYAVTADDSVGQTISSPVTQSDGTSARVLARGYTKGSARDGDAITFSVPFSNAPMIILKGGASYEPRAGKWSPSYSAVLPQYDEMVAVNPSASGFTLRARLRQKGAQTGQSDDFGAGTDLINVGDTSAATLNPAGATSDLYLIEYTVVLRIPGNFAGKSLTFTGSVTVAIDSNDGSGWVERFTQTYVGSTNIVGTYDQFDWDDTISLVVSGLGASDQFRIRIKSSTGSVYSVTVHGLTGSSEPHGVVYNTATDAYASKTPDADDDISWEAIAVS